jgi:hypothetical protein
MKQFLLGVLTTCLVLAIGVLGYLKFGFAEVRGDLPPATTAERRNSHSWRKNVLERVLRLSW